MKKEIFTIETNEGIAEFKGITLGDKWNGWECPMFPIRSIHKILADIGTEEDAKDCGFSFYEYDSLHDVIIERFYNDGKIEYCATEKPTIIDGIKYYSIGAYSWTWRKKSNYNF